MSSKTDKYLVFLVVFAIVLANSVMGFAEGEISQPVDDFEDPETKSGTELQETELQETGAETAETEDIAVKQEEFLARLKAELNLTKSDYRQVLNSVSDTNAKLNELSEDKMTLSEQIRNIDKSIETTTIKLFDVIKNILEKENEIVLLYEQVEIKEVAIEYQKNLIRDYVRIIYQEENNYLSVNENGEIEAFKLLLADGSVGDNLKEIEYFDLLNEAGQQMIDELSGLSEELLIHQKELDKKKAKLVELQTELETEKRQLELQKESKENLLALTKGQEDIYEQLLEQSVAEQEALLNDVKNLNNAIAFIEEKMREEGADFDPDEYISLLDYKTQILYDFQLNMRSLGDNDFAWPVDPDRGLSAYFRDPAYMGVFGVQHNAIDIPEYQGSMVRAAADGVVYTVRDNGYGYSYIILAHAGGFMTVYGHMSNILVAEGDVLTQGAVIGLSGGMPGTMGAGYMTTGPHLHFEILLNGLYVDPLDYLPLDVLTEDQIMVLPEKYYDDWEEDVEEANFEAIERF